jgi:ankyrin repeat protein
MNISICHLRLFHSHISRQAIVLLLTLVWSSFSCYAPSKSGTIHDAARRGDLAKARALLKDDPDLISSENQYEETPLHIAADYGRKDMVELLLANKADINASGEYFGWTALHLAADCGRKDVVGLLLVHGAGVNTRKSSRCFTRSFGA